MTDDAFNKDGTVNMGRLFWEGRMSLVNLTQLMDVSYGLLRDQELRLQELEMRAGLRKKTYGLFPGDEGLNDEEKGGPEDNSGGPDDSEGPEGGWDPNHPEILDDDLF